MRNNRPLIRRTFRQERFDILIKKQRNGNATFNDLTELDDIVNRDPEIRESILEEMHEHEHPTEGPKQEEIVIVETTKPPGLLQQLKLFINRLFMVEANGLKAVLLG
ncbi:hypothetical protein IDJ77_25775 [Mucilaginibacter sp. ZT4R22]|uniref:Uncharacterized protein n=1 Tax=Mucilaginibacter pankratovii TaxID=2772110 RepID=A0ABR7X138_9SPHI|nr:hypothetical protein [Mucilaginibacter pankratovii]MBD1367247.1 hypothetical protein [Mucilaginibacter pankratovii]